MRNLISNTFGKFLWDSLCLFKFILSMYFLIFFSSCEAAYTYKMYIYTIKPPCTGLSLTACTHKALLGSGLTEAGWALGWLRRQEAWGWTVKHQELSHSPREVQAQWAENTTMSKPTLGSPGSEEESTVSLGGRTGEDTKSNTLLSLQLIWCQYKVELRHEGRSPQEGEENQSQENTATQSQVRSRYRV